MNSLKLLLALALALVFTGCEITVVDDYSSYETDTYKTSYYDYTYNCAMRFTKGDARDVNYNSCSSPYSTYDSYAFDFSQYGVIEYYDNGSRISSTTYYVSDVEAFRYDGDIFIAYDVGGGLIFEYNYTDDEVGVYEDGIVDYYY